jgi:hypothetical protein
MRALRRVSITGERIGDCFHALRATSAAGSNRFAAAGTRFAAP